MKRQPKRASRKRPIQREALEQRALFQWARFMEPAHPELRWLFAIPNGGSRDPREAALLKAAGVKAGVSDLCLPVRTIIECFVRYCGLYIELKAKEGSNGASELQKQFGEFVQKQGYRFEVCYGWEAAAAVLCEHLGIRNYIMGVEQARAEANQT